MPWPGSQHATGDVSLKNIIPWEINISKVHNLAAWVKTNILHFLSHTFAKTGQIIDTYVHELYLPVLR